MLNSYRVGFRDGIPIGLGYLSVSFAFGILTVNQGFAPWTAVFISMTNVTSAGQVAGVTILAAGGTLLELALTQFLINLRYALMSLTLTQRFHPTVSWKKRALLAFFVTDEIFAVAASRRQQIGSRYFLGLATAPYLGWALGTALGSVFGSVLPVMLQNALGLAIYGMFVAIILPPMRKERAILVVVGIAAGLSCCFFYMPGLSAWTADNPGFVIIICAVVACLIGAWLFPVSQEVSSDA